MVDKLERHMCHRCGRSYKQKQHLNHHSRYECGREPHLKCPCCPWKTKTRSSLKRHVGTKHSDYFRNFNLC
ncbi:hypothetical protein J6590_014783 [Homalodisca vitripennis]|nr:hypothetical protein J6590_014783 [Homalodisca vitripennis]